MSARRRATFLYLHINSKTEYKGLEKSQPNISRSFFFVCQLQDNRYLGAGKKKERKKGGKEGSKQGSKEGRKEEQMTLPSLIFALFWIRIRLVYCPNQVELR